MSVRPFLRSDTTKICFLLEHDALFKEFFYALPITFFKITVFYGLTGLYEQFFTYGFLRMYQKGGILIPNFARNGFYVFLSTAKNADDADLAQINADLYFLSADRRSPLFLRTSAPVCVVCVLLIQCAKFPSTAYFTKTAYLFCQDSLLTLPMQLTCFYLLHQRGNGTASVDTSLNCGVKDIYNMV